VETDQHEDEYIDRDLCIDVATKLLKDLPPLQKSLDHFDLHTTLYTLYVQLIMILNTDFDYSETELQQGLSGVLHDMISKKLH